MATKKELETFLKDYEHRAFKRTVYQVRDQEAALDIVQDSMIKLSVHYADKPIAELPLLFSRILTNTTLDWFRKQKTHRAVFSSLDDVASNDDEGFDLLEVLEVDEKPAEFALGGEDQQERKQTLMAIETAVNNLPERQRQAFVLRYWDEMDTAETAQAMGCSEGSVKVHCFRAVQALSSALKQQGIHSAMI